MPSPVVYFYRPSSFVLETWLHSHVRPLHVHVVHHRTLSIADDGRIALATGPYLTVLRPPSFPPFHPASNPPLSIIFSNEPDTLSKRKDTLASTNHLLAVTWAFHSLLLLDGAASPSLLCSPLKPHSSHFAHEASHLWNAMNVPLSSSSSSLRQLSSPSVRCFSFTRVSYSLRESPTTLVFLPFFVCGTNTAADVFSLNLQTDSNSSVSMPTLRVHPHCTVAVACVDGVRTASGLSTLVAVADCMCQILVYKLVFRDPSHSSLQASLVWSASNSVPWAPVLSLSWDLHSSRQSFLSLAASSGNNVLVFDWGSPSLERLEISHWESPHVHCVLDAHDHLVTAVQVCHDGSVVSAGMDGRVICWRIAPPSDTCGRREFSISGSVLQERTETNECVMSLERSSSGFAVVSVTSIPRQGQELCDSEVLRKYSGAARRTTLRLVVIPPYGSADDVANAVVSCVLRMMSHPSCIDRAMPVWDVAHFVHSFSDCASAVVPQLCTNLVKLVEEHDARMEDCVQKFVQRTRSLLWFARVVNHPDSEEDVVREVVERLSTRLRNTLLFVRYMCNLQSFSSMKGWASSEDRMERLGLEQMCQFVSAWHVKGWSGAEGGIETVRKVRQWLEPFAGGDLVCWCAVCLTTGLELPLVADGTDPGTLCCMRGHAFTRCVTTGLVVENAVAMACSSCGARAVGLEEGQFVWVSDKGRCALCMGGLIGEQCESC